MKQTISDLRDQLESQKEMHTQLQREKTETEETLHSQLDAVKNKMQEKKRSFEDMQAELARARNEADGERIAAQSAYAQLEQEAATAQSEMSLQRQQFEVLCIVHVERVLVCDDEFAQQQLSTLRGESREAAQRNSSQQDELERLQHALQAAQSETETDKAQIAMMRQQMVCLYIDHDCNELQPCDCTGT